MSAVRVSGILVWTMVLWVALWHDLSVANVVSGFVVGAVVLAAARLPRLVDRNDDERSRLSPLRALHFFGYVLVKLVEANLFLAWEIVTKKNDINVGVVAVPLRTSSQTAAMVVANVITLTPGSITIEALGTPPVLYVNVMHLHDLERVRKDLLYIEELSVRAFGSASARRQLQEVGS